MKQSRKGMLMAALICGTIVPVLFGGTSAYAAEADESLSSFALEEMVVTAARYEKKDVDIAASTDVITRERLEDMGVTNAYEALQFSTGLTMDGKGPGGASYGSMTSKVAIRGIEKGTLVMLNGTPINFRGLYCLDTIPADIIEKIEIVRGGGSVLYGSEASGGVINIITKKDAKKSSVRVGFGKQDRQNHSIDIHAGGLGVNYTYDKWGHIGFISDSLAVNNTNPTSRSNWNKSQDFLKSELHNGTLTYRFSDNVDAIVRHSKRNTYTNYTFNDGRFGAVNLEPRYYRNYETNNTFGQVNFKDNKGFKGHVFYNRNVLKSNGEDYWNSTGTTRINPPSLTDNFERNLAFGADVQKLWEKGKNNYLLGLSVTREYFKDVNHITNSYENHARVVSSIYGSWETGIGTKNLFTLSARGTKVSGAETGKNYSNFSGQMQYTHKLNDNQSLYASIGQSFKLPTLKEMYANGNNMVLGNEDLKPEKGIHYEVGYKYVTKNHEWKAALFATRLKDSISYSQISGTTTWQTVNEDFKNMGLELSNVTRLNNGFTFNYGITLQNPKTKQESTNGTKTYDWGRKYGKFLLNGGVTYKKGKWTASLMASYLADRVMQSSSYSIAKTKPYLLTSLNVKYAPEKNQEIALSMDNILDRNNNVSHTSSYYYGTPFTFLVSYTYKF